MVCVIHLNSAQETLHTGAVDHLRAPLSPPGFRGALCSGCRASVHSPVLQIIGPLFRQDGRRNQTSWESPRSMQGVTREGNIQTAEWDWHSRTRPGFCLLRFKQRRHPYLEGGRDDTDTMLLSPRRGWDRFLAAPCSCPPVWHSSVRHSSSSLACRLVPSWR